MHFQADLYIFWVNSANDYAVTVYTLQELVMVFQVACPNVKNENPN